MAESMQFDLVSPERSLESRPVREVRLPGTDGDLTAMPGHAPLILTLRPGMVTVIGEDGQSKDYLVTGGFAEISPAGLTLLAERSHARDDVTQDLFNELISDARKAHQQAKEADTDVVDAAVKLLADMEALGTHIGLDPNQASIPD